MRISDWSSDVCSSDLRIVFPELRQPDVIDVAVPAGEQNALVLAQEHVDIGRDRPRLRDAGDLPPFDIELARRLAAIVEGSDRKRVVEGKSVSVRVDLGGRRSIKKKNQNTSNKCKKK